MKSILSTTALLIAALTMTMGLNARAESTDQNSDSSQPTTSKAKEGDKSAAKKNGDIDDEITNARLRAVTGAKSAFSFWSAFSYAGSSIQNPFSTLRPQLNSQNNADPTNLSGQVSGKYRITEHDSIIAGFGVQYTPGFTDSSGTAQGASTTASTPYVDYNRAFRIGGVQNVVDVAVSKYTLPSDLQGNLNWSWSVGDQVMKEVGDSKKLSLGVAAGLGQDVYTVDGQQPGSIALQVYFEPILEYAITEKASFRTVYRMAIANELADTNGTWKVNGGLGQTESIGLGYAITRDIYVYPNMQWPWSHMSAELTTVGFSANINL